MRIELNPLFKGRLRRSGRRSSAKLSEIYGVALSSFAYCSKEGDGAAKIKGDDGEGERSGMKPGRPSGVVAGRTEEQVVTCLKMLSFVPVGETGASYDLLKNAGFCSHNARKVQSRAKFTALH